MAHVIANASVAAVGAKAAVATSSASKQALGGNFSAGSLRLANRVASRKVAAQMAQRTVLAVVAEEVQAPASKALYDEFAKLLVNYEFSYKSGDRVTGKVFHCDSKGAWVDIGAKAAALCPGSEASLAAVRNVRPRSRGLLDIDARAFVRSSRRNARRRDARGVGARLPRGRRRATRFDGRFFFRFARSDFA
jgi:hypothetical protein|eukprot:31331-Pelagococcus_subviridis.AAC.4